MSFITPYKLETDKSATSFEFISEGPKGKIEKLIQFDLLSQDDELSIYNLAFGDKDATTGAMNDLAVSDNGDTEKVLMTVVGAILLFLNLQNSPNTWVYATSSTAARTRLYRMGISKYYNDSNTEMEVFGETENGWETFRRGNYYTAFVCRKLYI